MPRTPRSKKPNAANKLVPVKATEAEMTLRINTIHKLLVMGKPRPYILQYASDTWDASERSADEYIFRARELLKAQAERTREEHYQLALDRLDMIFEDSFDKGEHKDALGAQHQINKILGLYAPKEVNVSGGLDIKTYEKVSPDDWEDSDS